MKPGRNEPCPCGSGKKYKNCCLAAERQRSESPTELAWARVRRAIDGMPRLLGRFVADVYGPDAVEEAWDDFTLWEGYGFDPESPLMAVFMPWLYHCWEPDPWEDVSVVDEPLRGRTPTSLLLERHGEQFDPLFERYLAACLEAPFSFHEILRCDSGHGFRVRDVITGEEHEVLERSASESMSVGDVLFAQLVPIEGIVLLEACSPYALSPVDKIAIIELREQIEAAPPMEPDLGGPLRNWGIEIRELYLELIGHVLDRRPPVLHNTDGELLKLQRVLFDIDDAERVFAALAHTDGGAADADVERAADGRLERVQFPWTKAGNRLHASWENTVLGHIEISSARLVAHVNSDERARAFRDIVEQALGSAARYRGSELVERDELDAELEGVDSEGGTADEDLALLPEVREHLDRMFERHYDDWATQELPVLGGRRPIDVVREPNGREKVEALVADMERHAARMNPGVGEAAFARLRERLGLTRQSLG
jgi:hypothetical protein